jgi:hypothetical protein
MATLGYCTVGSNRLGDAKSFYDALLGSAGIAPLFEHPSGGRKGTGARRRRRWRPRRTRPEVLHVVLSRPRWQQALRLLHGLKRADDNSDKLFSTKGETVTHAKSFFPSAAWLLPVVGAAVRGAEGACDQVDAIHPGLIR